MKSPSWFNELLSYLTETDTCQERSCLTSFISLHTCLIPTHTSHAVYTMALFLKNGINIPICFTSVYLQNFLDFNSSRRIKDKVITHRWTSLRRARDYFLIKNLSWSCFVTPLYCKKRTHRSMKNSYCPWDTFGPPLGKYTSLPTTEY